MIRHLYDESLEQNDYLCWFQAFITSPWHSCINNRGDILNKGWYGLNITAKYIKSENTNRSHKLEDEELERMFHDNKSY